MVTLTEEIEIPAPFEKLNAWLDHFEEEFVRWSPYHLECQLLDGGIRQGDRVRFYEIVMGMDYDVTGTLTSAERDSNHFCFRFRSDTAAAVIQFEGNRTDHGCFFRHTESFGLSTLIIGSIVNFLIFRVLYRKQCDWKLIRDDMILDNRYLKEILTEEKYPERIPIEELKKK
ncbi:MAG: hypothetical protein ACI4WR_11345 [Bulleidia sp.]